MILIAILLFISIIILVKMLKKPREGFYDPTKEDQRPFNMENHSYDGDLYQSEVLLYNSINKMEQCELKDHLSELLNILQFI